MPFNLDIAIFLVFLLINLSVGIYYGRGVKTIRDYALGGRNFSTGALVSTIAATWVSGSGFFITISKTYSDGLYYVIASSGMAISFLLSAFIFIPRMGEFLGTTSIAEAMGNFYGKEVRVITAITGTITSLGFMAVQFRAFGNIFDYFLGFPNYLAVILAGVVVTLYSTFGGIRSVTFTDVFQFFTFGFGIPLVGILIWNQLNSAGFVLSEALQNPLFNYKEVFNIQNPKLWEMIPLLLVFITPGMEPVFFQRVAMGKDIGQVKKAFIISAVIIVGMKLIIAWIPFLIFNINPNIDPNKLLTYIVDNYTYPGLKGLIIIGIASMAMSSADSVINASSVLLSHDLLKPLNIGKNKELYFSRLFGILLGILSILLALYMKDLLTIILATHSFYLPIVTVPLLLTILGFRSSKKSVLIGMLAGFLTVISWNFLNIKANPITTAMIINLIFLMGSHYVLKQEGGWVGVKDKTYIESIRYARKKRRERIINKVKNFNFIEFCKRTSPTNELTYMGLGIYCILYTFTTIYSTQVELLKDNDKVILTIYQLMMITGVLMAMYPIWPERIKKQIVVQVAWNIVIYYMLIFFSCFFVMLSDFSRLQFAVFTINMIITAILIGWRMALGFIITGFYLSVQFYKNYMGLESLDIGFGSPQFMFIYSLILAGSALIIFLKPKEELQALTEERNEHLSGRINEREKALENALALKEEFIRNINHEFHAPMTGISSTAQVLAENYDKLNDAQRKIGINAILKSSINLERFEGNLVNLSKLLNAHYNLKIAPVNLGSLVYDQVEICKKLYAVNEDLQKFVVKLEDNIWVSCDEYYIKQVVDNLIINAITYCKQGVITIEVIKHQSYVEFTIKDEGIGIPKDELLNIFDPFSVSSKTHTIAGGRGIGLTLCKKIIELHQGEIWAENNIPIGASFSFILPITEKI